MIKRELIAFLIVGCLAACLDYLSYRALACSGLFNVHMAKGAGFLIGTLFAYFANRTWTFGRQARASGSVWRFFALYTMTLVANMWINAWTLSALNHAPIAIPIAFLLATGVSATLNFLGMKYFVFNVRSVN